MSEHTRHERKMRVWLVAPVTLLTLGAYALFIMIADQVPEINVRNTLAIVWTAAWLLGLTFGAWNVSDAFRDALAAVRRKEPKRVVVGAFWLLRSDIFQTASCLMMVIAGFFAMLTVGPTGTITVLLMLGGFCIVVNQVWGRVDREILVAMPIVGGMQRLRLLERRLHQVTGAGRLMGHTTKNHLAVIIGALVLMKEHGHLLSPDMQQHLDASIEAVEQLGEEMEVLHGQIRRIDQGQDSQETTQTGEQHGSGQ